MKKAVEEMEDLKKQKMEEIKTNFELKKKKDFMDDEDEVADSISIGAKAVDIARCALEPEP